MYGKGGKNLWALFLLILAGIVIGGFIGQYLGGFSGFGWLKLGEPFGLKTPVDLTLGIINLQFGLMIDINVAGIIGIIIAIIVYKKI